MTFWLIGVSGLLVLSLLLFGFGVTSEYRGVHRPPVKEETL